MVVGLRDANVVDGTIVAPPRNWMWLQVAAFVLLCGVVLYCIVTTEQMKQRISYQDRQLAALRSQVDNTLASIARMEGKHSEAKEKPSINFRRFSVKKPQTNKKVKSGFGWMSWLDWLDLDDDDSSSN